MSEFFRPYEGERPFMFVSYAHRQSDAVVDTLRILHEKGWRVWYDEGIPAGSDWPANIAEHMQSCAAVLFFLSRRSMESHNCYSEMRTAARLGKPILVIRLEEGEIDDRWRELLDGKQEIPLLDSPEKRAEAILRSGFLSRRYHRSRLEGVPWRALGFAASLLLFLAAAGAFGALATGYWTPVPSHSEEPVAATPAPQPDNTGSARVEIPEAERYFTVRFPDSLQEQAARRVLGIKGDEGILRWQMAEIHELYLCGWVLTNAMENIGFDADGTCRVNGAPLIMGPVSDLSPLEYAVSLQKLALVCQPLGNISPVSGHVLLKELSLGGSTVDSVAPLTELPSLEILHLEHTGVWDLTPLSAFPRLKTVTVSRDMLPLTWDDEAAFVVELARVNPPKEETP